MVGAGFRPRISNDFSVQWFGGGIPHNRDRSIMGAGRPSAIRATARQRKKLESSRARLVRIQWQPLPSIRLGALPSKEANRVQQWKGPSFPACCPEGRPLPLGWIRKPARRLHQGLEDPRRRPVTLPHQSHRWVDIRVRGGEIRMIKIGALPPQITSICLTRNSGSSPGP